MSGLSMGDRPYFDSDNDDIDDDPEIRDEHGNIKGLVDSSGRPNLEAIDDLCELFDSIEKSNILIIGAGAIGLLCGLILSKVKNCKNIFIVDTNEKRIKESLKYLEADGLNPNDKAIKNNYFDIVFDTVGLETTRQQAIKCIKPGGIIIHIGLTQPSGNFDFRKATLQEITFVGTYCYTNKDFEKTLDILDKKKIGSLDWIKYKKLKDGSSAFKEIHDGSCSAPKIILLVNS